MAQAKAKNAQILTTDRGGPLRLALGGVLLAIGLGWAFAMVMSTVSAWNTLRLFRDTANGLAGRCCAYPRAGAYPRAPICCCWPCTCACWAY